MKLNELIEKRTNITSQIDAILAVDLTDETRTQVVDLEKEFDQLGIDIETAKRQAERAKTVTIPVEEARELTNTSKYVNALRSYFSTGRLSDEFSEYRGFNNGILLRTDLLTTTDTGLIVKDTEQKLNIAKTPVLIDKLPITRKTGIKGQFDLTAMAEITAAFVGEGVAVPDASAYPQTPVTLAPRRLGAYQVVSSELLNSTNPNVWADIVQDILDAWDRKVSSDAITQFFADAVDASTTITGSTFAMVDALTLQSNVPYDMAYPVYIAAPAVASKLAATASIASVEGPIWKGNIFEGTVSGIPAYSNSAVPANHFALLDATKLTNATFSPKTLMANPYEYDVEGKLKITVSGEVDSGFGNYRFASWIADVSMA
jgi:hypothetical protein